MSSVDLQPIHDFLPCKTPQAWIHVALQHESLLLIDHANCEKKAASTALQLMYRYTEHTDLLNKMSRLAREELRHFEQVLAIIEERDIDYVYISSSRYASELRQYIRKNEPEKLIDVLIIGALIEARSCERFAALAPYLDEQLQKFYTSLLRSEARHFQDYLQLAQQLSSTPIDDRVNFFVAKEQGLIESPDTEFRFHSGVPMSLSTAA